MYSTFDEFYNLLQFYASFLPKLSVYANLLYLPANLRENTFTS